MGDINKIVTDRFIKEITLKGWTKERYNKEMKKSPRWITRVKKENRDWTISNFMNSCTLLDIAPSSILKFKVKGKDLCDLTVREILGIFGKENSSHFIENHPEKLSMIMNFIKMQAEVS